MFFLFRLRLHITYILSSKIYQLHYYYIAYAVSVHYVIKIHYSVK